MQKPYAKKMEYLSKVWDGSKGDVGDNLGFWGCMAVACDKGGDSIEFYRFLLSNGLDFTVTLKERYVRS